MFVLYDASGTSGNCIDFLMSSSAMDCERRSARDFTGLEENDVLETCFDVSRATLEKLFCLVIVFDLCLSKIIKNKIKKN